MKKRMLSLLLALVMVLSLLTVAAMANGVQTFADVKATDWFYDAVCYVTEHGLMNGNGRGFAPQQTTSRAMLWVVLSRVDGQNAKRNANDWYAAAQLWAIQHDISDGTAPEAPITREQLASMLYRYAQRKGLVRAAVYADLSGFADAASIHAYADEAMQWAVANGILTGMDGKLCPQGNATRAQVAQILYRLCETWDLLAADNTAAIASAIYLADDPEHTHVWTYTSNQNGTHTATCACGESKTEYCGFPKETGTVTCPTCGFTTEHGVKNYEDLAAAIQAGGEVFITDDIAAERTIWIREDTTVHGDGHTLTINDDGFTGKTLFENADGKKLTLDHIVIDGEKKDRTNCLVLIKNNLAELTVLNSEIKNFNGTQIIASRERTGKLTVKDTTIHDNALKTFTTTTGWGHGAYHNYYTEELATLIWVQKNDAVFENVSITKNTVDTGSEKYDHKTCLGNGILIFFSGDNTGSTFYASNLIIEENEAPRHIFATYATLNKHTYTFESGHIGDNTVNDPANAIFVVGNLTVGKDMTVKSDIVINNDGQKGVCTLTNDGTIIGDITSAQWAVSSRGLPQYTGSGTHTGERTNFQDLTVNP